MAEVRPVFGPTIAVNTLRYTPKKGCLIHRHYRHHMLERICQLLEIIAPEVEDRETIDELIRLIEGRGRWSEAHDLFSGIRAKTLRANAAKNKRLSSQYGFEEICAKCIYNESDASATAPFDQDSPFWVLPLALHAARELAVD